MFGKCTNINILFFSLEDYPEKILLDAPVAPDFLSEWVPVSRLIEGLHNEYMPLRYRLQ